MSMLRDRPETQETDALRRAPGCPPADARTDPEVFVARPDSPRDRGPGQPRGDQGTPPRDVEVRIPASPTAVVTMRTVAADLAARAEFTLDAVADLRMAVDEACSCLVARARPDTRLTCTFVLDDDRITVTASVSTARAGGLPTDSFGWRVLTTLATDVRTLAAAPGNDGDPHRLALRLAVHRLGTPLS